MANFTIPVAFSVAAETEEQAAAIVVNALAHAQIDMTGPIEDWSTPNHASADGSTDEGDRLVWSKDPARASMNTNTLCVDCGAPVAVVNGDFVHVTPTDHDAQVD